MYIAKTSPRLESLYEHTDNLVDRYKKLKELYKDDLNINWSLLKLACLYHDLGKVNRVFQARLKKEKLPRGMDDIPHGYLSILFIDYRKLMNEYSLTQNEIRILVNSVAFHHKREEFNNEMKEKLKRYMEYLIEDAEKLNYDKLPNVQNEINNIPLRMVRSNSIAGFNKDIVYDYILIKGLLNKIDFAASGNYEIEYENNFLEESLEKYKQTWGKDADFNELQKFMRKNQNKNVITIAETGYGKTEAGLLWIGDNKGFFTLPLRTAINQIYERITDGIVKENIDKRVGLLHSDILAEYSSRNKKGITNEVLEYAQDTRELSMPLTICTIDQIFDFVYKYVGFERKLATLSYSKVVIDEIQMYSSDLVAYIIIAISQISKVGGKFSIITATFPPFIKDLLEKENIEFQMPKPFLKENRIRHSIKLIEDEIKVDYILNQYDNNKVLVIVNTVRQLNKLYDELKNEKVDNLNIFHSNFIKRDRKKKEDKIKEFGKKKNNEIGIWICTQVAEASLDIDFDVLITELSDLNGLYQRMGRCYRNRKLDKDYNIIVCDGGKKKCSGIGNVNDEDIYIMSKEYLRKKGNGQITEREKIESINEIYSTEKLRDTKYYKDIRQTMTYINDSVQYEEFRKEDVLNYFRNISSVTIIPSPVYDENREYVEKQISILKEDLKDGNVDKLYLKKQEARLNLDQFKASIPFYYVDNNNLEIIEIDKYEKLNIYKCDYNDNIGIIHLEAREELESNIF